MEASPEMVRAVAGEVIKRTKGKNVTLVGLFSLILSVLLSLGYVKATEKSEASETVVGLRDLRVHLDALQVQLSAVETTLAALSSSRPTNEQQEQMERRINSVLIQQQRDIAEIQSRGARETAIQEAILGRLERGKL